MRRELLTFAIIVMAVGASAGMAAAQTNSTDTSESSVDQGNVTQTQVAKQAIIDRLTPTPQDGSGARGAPDLPVDPGSVTQTPLVTCQPDERDVPWRGQRAGHGKGVAG